MKKRSKSGTLSHAVHAAHALILLRLETGESATIAEVADYMHVSKSTARARLEKAFELGWVGRYKRYAGSTRFTFHYVPMGECDKLYSDIRERIVTEYINDTADIPF